jgi:outer membrane lipoprotein-sorting protein
VKAFRVFAAALAFVFALGLGAAADNLAPSAPPPAMTPAGTALFTRMTAVNASVKSLTAEVHLDVALKSFPFIKQSLDGNYYYKQPDKQAVVFDTVPMLAKEFRKVYPRVEPPALWTKIYTFGVASEDDKATTFRLVPLKNGRVEHLDVKVDNATATVASYTWTYKDGGSVTVDQTMENVSGAFVAASQTGRVDLPSYKAETTAEYRNYKLNVALADKLFQE